MAKEKVTFSKWDVTDHLKTEKDIQAYLEVAAENNDSARFARALGDVIRARNMSKIARKFKLTRQGLSKALSEDGNPRLDTIMKVLSALGLRLTFAPAVKPRTKKSNKTR
jgi:probable addiction module antidote protein